jgi:hypothetical protein
MPNELQTYKRIIAILSILVLVAGIYGGYMTYAVLQNPQSASVVLHDNTQSIKINVDVFFLDHSFRYELPFNELTAGGWKVVSVTENGVLYKLQIHNVMTNCFANFAQKQLAGTSGLFTNGGNYIGLTANSTSNGQNDCNLQGEITTNGLARAQGTVTFNSTAISAGDVSWKISKTWSVTGTQTVSKAGLFIDSTVATCSVGKVAPLSSSGCALAVTLVSPAVSAISGDSLQIDWTVSWSS